MEFSNLIALISKWCQLELAEDWDNVGLLVQPPSLWRSGASVERVLLCIDATSAVISEARAKGARLVIAYHPVVFSSMKRITPDAGTKQRVVCEAIENGIAVFSPHTSLDAKPGGINDWLAEGLGNAASCEPVKPATNKAGEVLKGAGAGRIVALAEPVPVSEIVGRVKARLGPGCHVRLAESRDGKAMVRTVAICAGSGAELLRSAKVDLLLSGEIGHHGVLEAVERGIHVVLAEHTSTERGFLHVLKSGLEPVLGQQVQVIISEADHEILRLA